MIRLCLAVLSTALIPRLGSDSVRDRDLSSRVLVRLGAAALGPLREAQRHSDPEVTGRAREAYYSICSRMPAEDRCRRNTDLHSLSVSVQRSTGITLLWTEELGLPRHRVRLVSDLCLRRSPELWFHVYRSSLMAHDLAMVPVGREAQTVYKLRPCVGKRSTPAEFNALRLVTRAFCVKSKPPEALSADFFILPMDGFFALIITAHENAVSDWEDRLLRLGVR